MQQKKAQATNPKTVRHVKSEAIKVLEKLAIQKLKECSPDNHYYPQPKYTDKTTNELTKCVIDYIRFNSGQAEKINQRAFIKNNRKTPTYTLGAIAIGSNELISRIRKKEAVYIHSVIKWKIVRIEIKREGTEDNNHPIVQNTCKKEIEDAKGMYLIVRNFTDFYNWFNQFVKD